MPCLVQRSEERLVRFFGKLCPKQRVLSCWGVVWPESAPFLVAKWDLVYGDRGALLQKKNIVVDVRGALLSFLLTALSIWDTELTVLGVL